MDSVSSDGPSDDEIKQELKNRLAQLKDGRDLGHSFSDVLGEDK